MRNPLMATATNEDAAIALDRLSAQQDRINLCAARIDAENTDDWFKMRAKGTSWAIIAMRDAEALDLL